MASRPTAEGRASGAFACLAQENAAAIKPRAAAANKNLRASIVFRLSLFIVLSPYSLKILSTAAAEEVPGLAWGSDPAVLINVQNRGLMQFACLRRTNLKNLKHSEL
jgi:hypothetical protein